MRRIIYLLLLSLLVITACKKSSTDPGTTTTTTTATTTIIPPATSTLDGIRDSVYLYTKEEYLWYDAIPAYATFNPRSYTGADDPTALQNEVNALSQFKINPATNLPYEYSTRNPGSSKYSFIDAGQVSSTLAGNNGDFGFSVFYYTYSDLRIKYVNPGSPASAMGLVRGYKITAVNGNSNILIDPNTKNANADPNLLFVVNALSGSTITLTLQKPDNSTITKTIAVANYTSNPVLKTTVVTTTNGKKVGYLAFSSFTSPANAGPHLDSAFTNFVAQGVTDLVVDLRYNGGGYVSTAEYLDNLIVPPSKTGTTMYTEFYNDQLQNDKYPLLAKIYQINPGDFKPANNTSNFAKRGTLNIARVFFIVTGSTASASELTINNLIPEMDVKLIGTTSYGKPVGFFAIPVNKYQLYVPEFESKNSAGAGGYYAGMTPGSATYPGFYDNDDITHDFGDPNEVLFAHALSYVTKGTYSVVGNTSGGLTTQSITNQLSESQVNAMAAQLDRKHFTGMIANKKLVLKH